VSKELTISNLDQHLKPLQIDGITTPVELSTEDVRMNKDVTLMKDLTIEGDLNVVGTTSGLSLDHGIKINPHASINGGLNITASQLALFANTWEGDGDTSDNNAILALIPSDGYDSSISFMEGASTRWAVGNDADDSDKLKFDAGTPVIGGATKLTLDSSGNLTLVGDLAVNGDDITTDGNMNLDSGGSLTLDAHDGNFIASKAGTEFSAANSAYAGMILGYRMIGEDAAEDTYTLTTSMVVPDSAMTVRFIAPPSGAVEVMVQVYIDQLTTRRNVIFGLSDNATYNSLGNSYEHKVISTDDRENDTVVQNNWTITGLTAGDTYNYWFGAKISAVAGTLIWGGTSSGESTDFIMKVTALPTAVSDFAEYD